MSKWFNAFGKSNEIEKKGGKNTKTKSSKLVSWVKSAIFAGMMATSSWVYAKNNTQEINYQNSFETGISFSMDTSDLQNVVGSNFRHMNDKIEIKNGKISIESSPNFTNILRFAVEQKNGLRTIFEVWKDKKVIVKKHVAQSDAASFIRAKKSIDDISAESDFKLNSANVSSDSSSASFSYKSTQVRATDSSVSADYDFSENTKLSASAGENNNTVGWEYKFSENSKLIAKAWDKNIVWVEHKFDKNISGTIWADESGASVGTRFTSDDGKYSASLSGWESTQVNLRAKTPEIFGEEAIINIWATYSDDTIGYNATLGQIFWDDFAYSLEASKRWEEQLFLIKSALKLQANMYLTAIYSSLKMSGLEYNYDEFLDANHISDLSFGELKEIYEMTQKTIGFGLSYVSGPNLISLNYYNSSADNVLFDDRINARYNPENKDIIITEKIQVAATGYNTQTIEAAYEYRVNNNFTFKGSIWYEMTQLKALYDLEEENLSNVRFSIGWEYTTNVFAVWNQDMRINTDVNYSHSEFNENFKTKLSFDFQDTWLARNGLYPYISYEKQDINGIKDDSIGFGISGTFGNTPRTKDIRDVIEQDYAPAEQFNGPLNRFAKYTTHLWDYFMQEGVAELRKSETVENAHDYVIYLGALSTTGSFISNIESVSDLIEVKDSQLIFKGINSGAFDSLAGKEFRLALALTNGNIYPLDIKTTQGSTNITLTAEKSSDIKGLSSDAWDTFVDQMSSLYTTSDVNFIKDNYYKNTISSNLVSHIFTGNILPEIISLGYIWGQMTLEALEFLANNIDTYNQNNILELLNNWGQIDLDVLKATLNQAPTLSNITFGTLEDVSKEISYSEILAWANDKETPKDKLTLAKIAGVDFQGANTPDVQLGLWTLSFWESSMVFTPKDEVSGEQIFDVQVADEKGQLSNAATATVNIKNVDDNPEIILEDFDLNEDGKVIISRDQIISDIDTNLEDVNLLVESLDTKTTVQFLANGDLEVIPADNENGDFSIKLTVTQWDFTDTKNISGTIIAKNDAPKITDENSEFSLNETEVVKIDLSKHFYDIDIDDILSFVLPEWLDSNSFSLENNILTISNPWVNSDVLHEFKITAVDLEWESVEKDFSITFKNSVNDAPVWVADTFEMQEGVSQLVDVLKNDIDLDWDNITISSISNAQNASLEIVDNKIKVTPDANYFGPISFEYTPISNGVEWNVTTVSWNVIAVNDAPEIILENINLDEEGTIIIAKKDIAVDIDTPLEELNFQVLINGEKVDTGFTSEWLQVTWLKDLTWDDKITLQVSDEDFDIQKEITIVIKNINDAPVAENSSANVLENSSNNTITLNISDVDGDALTLQNVVSQNGTVSINPDNTLSYTPNSWVTGPDTITYEVNDGELTDSWVVTVNIWNVNDAPVATFDSFTTNEDTTFSGQLTATDIDWDILNYWIKSTATNGTVSVNSDGTFTYVPNTNFNGTDTFEYEVSDGELTDTQVVTVTVDGVNDAPVAIDSSANVLENSSNNTITLNISDVDGDALTLQNVVSQNGTVSINPDNTLSYTPNSWVTGPDTITYEVNDGELTDSWVVTVNIWNVNDAPVATFDSFTTNEDTTFSGQLTATDIDWDILNYWIKSTATNGTVSVNSDGTFTYVPNTNFNGTDTFEYEVSDGELTDTQVVTVTVEAINDAPIVKNTSVTTVEDAEFVNLPVDITYVDSTSHTFTSFSAQHGEVWVTWENTLRYKPEKDYFGDDVAKYEITDNNGLKSTGEIAIEILNYLDAPVATFDSFTTNEDSAFNGQLTATDVDSEDLTFSRVQQAENATVTINSDGTFTYIPNENFNGTDTFEYQVSDGMKSANQVVTVTVNAINDAPEAKDLSSTFWVDEWESLEINLDNHIFDVDNEVLWFSVESGLDNSDYSINGNILTVINPWVTQDTLKNVVVKAVDLAWESAEKDFLITFKNSVNENVVFSNFNPITSIAEWETESFTFNYDDPNGDAITLELKLWLGNAPDFATLVDHKDGSATVTFAPWYEDADTYRNFAVEATEPSGDTTTTAWFHLTVEETNRAPVITSSASFSTDEDTPYNGVVTATDEDNDTLTYSVSMQPAHGDINLNSSTWEYSYTPDENYHWADSIEFSAFDGVATVTKKMTLDVNSIIDNYELVDGNFPTTAKGWDSYSHTFTLKDVDNVVNTVSIVNKPDWMSFSDLGNGEYSMTGTPDYDTAGTYQNVTISINGKNEVIQSIVVENTNRAPELLKTFVSLEAGIGQNFVELDVVNVVEDDSTIISELEIVDVELDTSIYAYTYVWTKLRVERIDRTAWYPDLMKLKFQDKWWLKSEIFTLELDGLDDN